MKGFIEVNDDFTTKLINVNYIQLVCADNEDTESTNIVVANSNGKSTFYNVNGSYETVRAKILEAMK